MLRCRFKSIVILRLVIFVLFVSVMTGFVFSNFEEPFETAFTAYAYKIGNEAINNAVDTCFNDVSYKDIVSISKNSQDEIVSLSGNIVMLNKIKSDIAESVNSYVSSGDKKYVSLYMGSLQSKAVLAGFGPKFKIKVKPYSVTKANFRDEFVSVGINQVRHCVYIDTYVTVTVVGMGSCFSVDIKNSLPVADTIIVGRVPQVYGGYFTGFNNKLE